MIYYCDVDENVFLKSSHDFDKQNHDRDGNIPNFYLVMPEPNVSLSTIYKMDKF